MTTNSTNASLHRYACISNEEAAYVAHHLTYNGNQVAYTSGQDWLATDAPERSVGHLRTIYQRQYAR